MQNESKKKVTVYACSSDIPESSADFTFIAPGIGTHSFRVSSPWEARSAFLQPKPRSTNFHSTWYPLLLVGQRQCGLKACPRILLMPSTAGVEPQVLRSRDKRLNHSARRSTSPPNSVIKEWLDMGYCYTDLYCTPSHHPAESRATQST